MTSWVSKDLLFFLLLSVWARDEEPNNAIFADGAQWLWVWGRSSRKSTSPHQACTRSEQTCSAPLGGELVHSDNFTQSLGYLDHQLDAGRFEETCIRRVSYISQSPHAKVRTGREEMSSQYKTLCQWEWPRVRDIVNFFLGHFVERPWHGHSKGLRNGEPASAPASRPTAMVLLLSWKRSSSRTLPAAHLAPIGCRLFMRKMFSSAAPYWMAVLCFTC